MRIIEDPQEARAALFAQNICNMASATGVDGFNVFGSACKAASHLTGVDELKVADMIYFGDEHAV